MERDQLIAEKKVYWQEIEDLKVDAEI